MRFGWTLENILTLPNIFFTELCKINLNICNYQPVTNFHLHSLSLNTNLEWKRKMKSCFINRFDGKIIHQDDDNSEELVNKIIFVFIFFLNSKLS